MSFPSITHLTRLVRRFQTDTRGNVAIIFAIVSIPLVALVGAAVDYTRAVSDRTALQSALDSAALMISKDAATMTASQITTRARQYVDALYTATEAPIQNFTATYTPNSGSGASILLSANGTMPTYFMRVLGNNFSTLPVATSSTTKWGSTRMRVALVLDNTGSMAQNGKMSALQSAATDMITKLSAFNVNTGDVYISIVPFAKDVNVGISNVSQTWLNWTEWMAEPPYLRQNGYPNNLASSAGITTPGVWIDMTGPKSSCPFTNSSHGFTCTDRPATLSSANSASKIPSTGNYNGMICPGMDSGNRLSGKYRIYYNGCYTSVPVTLKWTGSSATCTGKPSGCSCTGSGSSKVCTLAAYRHDWRNVPADPNAIPAADSSLTKYAATNPSDSASNGGWEGCVNDRDQNFDTTNDAMSGSGTPSKLPYPEQWADCLPATITPMSNQWSNLKSQINAMTPSGNTDQAVGLFWGWQTLNTANDPFKAPAKDPNWVYKDYIVLLSDGLNTQNRWTQTVSDIDSRQETLCKNIKDPAQNGGNQITVFSIQVNINSRDPTSQVLQDCATPGAGYFQMITQSTQTADAFNNILATIAKLRISQ
ncbi:pilus assembly protein [[Pseudomonas] carboxydohydrogena]|uniref:Pilus assembly protein n=1 Tax=Afipia carboxydohydrogena TaxID=290 RepID=A0ABY8BSF3_AFICR|nr:TadE/TadG family type IV pilus assembly protein [[Pseudomonas] carboxydohydrogena]WEF52903.1 pilus assembly protein [[Pseudomonas] carboxydohydrogena]